MSAQAFILLYSIPLLGLLRWQQLLDRGDAAGPGATTLLRWALALGLLLRLACLWDSGFHYDTGTYKAWALKLSDPSAPLQIYEPGYFADYPPLYMYVLATLGGLARILGLEGGSHFTALIKLPALLADLAVTLLIARHAPLSNGSTDQRQRIMAACLYWLNPAVMFDSALWGQTEALLCLALVIAWLQLQQQRLWACTLALAAAIAFKPQGLVFAYVLFIGVLFSVPLRTSLKQLGIGAISFALIILPFAQGQDFDWIFRLYFSTAETYDYLTVNAYNFWALWGWNWAADPGQWLGLELQTWAMLLGTAALSLTGWNLARGLRQASDARSRGEAIAWSLALASVAFFLLAPRMHERYILTVLPMLALLPRTGMQRSLIMLWTATALLNLGYVYHHYIGLDQVAPADTVAIRLISALAVLTGLLSLLAYLRPALLARVGKQLGRIATAVPAIPQRAPRAQLWRGRFLLPYILLGSAALLLGGYQLGNRNHPSSGQAVTDGAITLQYAEAVQASTLLVYAASGSTRIRLEYLGEQAWVSALNATELSHFYKTHQFELVDLPPARAFRLRLDQSSDDARLLEIGLLDAAGRALVPVHSNAPKLFDEMALWQADQGYMGSTYFDEIYHARTAYEYLHQLPVYETTHPPLGKWLISLGIDRFGMTPWGMRIAGVLASSAIVLALIWGAWLFTQHSRAMWLAGLLGLFEFSRFSIGRYATIDSFLILFLLLAALWLWQAFSPRRQERWLAGWQLSPALLLAGLFLGAAIAVKWSALYLGVGLFLFFLYSVWRGWRQGKQAAISLPAMLLGAGCSFVLIPLMVYLLSYIPFLACLPDSPALWSKEGLYQVLKSQFDMYDYHANLDSSHAFSAAFYTWPLILKPLWLFVDESRLPLRSSITLLGNPVIWWSALALLLAKFSGHLSWPRRESTWLLVILLSLYLPWLLVSRISFIYHYYPIVPFLILLLAISLHRLPQGSVGVRQRSLTPLLIWSLPALSGLLFLLFWPSISGLPVLAHWTVWLRWLPGWWML